jgi:hypothetical protein
MESHIYRFSRLHFPPFFICYAPEFMSFRISHIHEYDRFISLDLGSYRVRASLYTLKEGKLSLE